MWFYKFNLILTQFDWGIKTNKPTSKKSKDLNTMQLKQKHNRTVYASNCLVQNLNKIFHTQVFWMTIQFAYDWIALLKQAKLENSIVFRFPSLFRHWSITEKWTNDWRKQDREKIPKQHLGDTVEELKRFNARRKLKGAVQAIAGGLANDPLCGTDTDSGKNMEN